MKKLLLILAAGLFGYTANAQDLPKPSPLAKMEQMVGLTNISVEYSRPSKKGRTIFGDLVPYDQIWRLGANASTKITITTDITIQGKALKAGTYSVLAIPNVDIWTLVFNTDLELRGTGNYDAKKNVLEVKSKVVKIDESVETFSIAINNVTHQSAMLSFEWENTKVDFAIGVETNKIAEANIQAALKKGEDLDQVYYKAASFYYNTFGEDKKALTNITKGLNVKQGHALQFLRAQILMDQGHKEEAIKYAKKAHQLAEEADSTGWADYIQGTIDAWTK